MAERDVLKEALERFQESQDATDFNRTEYERMTRFARLGDQWDAQVKRERQAEGRPALTINRLSGFAHQVINEARQSRPGIKVSPVDGEADEDTAEVIGGLVRSVERHSNASQAYDTAIDHAVSGGFGFFRLEIDYAHADSFDLECRIRRVANPLSVHWDPNSTAFDASDWEYAFVSDMLTLAEFERRFPDAKAEDFAGDTRDTAASWIDGERVRVAEYWLRERSKRKLLMVRNVLNGEIVSVREDSLDGYLERLAGQIGADPAGLFEVIRERDVDFYEVRRRKVSGAEVLEEDTWPGSMIPIAPVWGEEVIIDGWRHFRSLFADAEDPQKNLNFWRSAATELVALAPRAPWLIADGQLPDKGTERAKWGTANTRSHSYLMYQNIGGAIPQRVPFAGIPAGALQEAMNAQDDLKATIGIYDAALGARSNETSGRAILARQRESDTANFHFLDNLNTAIGYIANCLVEAIPSVYGPRQTIRILGEDMTEKVVRLVSSNPSPEPGVEGEPRLYDLSVGKYDVTVRAGPSYQTQRDEAREVLLELSRAAPNLIPAWADVLLDNMDFTGADKIAERLRNMFPQATQAGQGPMQGGQPPQGPMPPQGPPGPQGGGAPPAPMPPNPGAGPVPGGMPPGGPQGPI